MRFSKWAFTYYLRFWALLGFFLANSAFAGETLSTSYGLDACYSTFAEACNLHPKTMGHIGQLQGATICWVRTSGGNTVGYLTPVSCTLPTPTPTPSPTPTPTLPPCLKTLGNAPGGSCTSKSCTISVSTVSDAFTVFGNYKFCNGGCEYKGAVEQQWSTVIDRNPDGTVATCAIGGCKEYFRLSGVHGTGRTCDANGQPVPGSDNLPVISAPTIPPTSAPVGKCPGEVNGQTVYVDCLDSSKGDSQTTVTSNPDGTTTTTKTDTVCKSGSCESVVTETTKDASGTTTSTNITQRKFDTENGFCEIYPSSSICKGKDREEKGFCEQNPDLAVCKEGSFSGTCGAAPACSGDEVQCAQAEFAFKQYCLAENILKPDPNSVLTMESALNRFNAAASAGDSGVWSGVNVDTADLSDIGLTVRTNQSNNPFPSGCPADIPITLVGQSFVIPLSKLCSVLQLAGTLIKAIALLMGAVILFKPKT